VLERNGKPLLAGRYYARNGLNSWNLAAVGDFWPSAESGAVKVHKLRWLSITFSTKTEKLKFNNMVAELIQIFEGRMNEYRRDLNTIKETNIISQTV
jgi:hypothetical protein